MNAPRLVCFCIACALLCSMASISHAAEPPSATAEPGVNSLEQMWAARAGDLETFLQEAEQLRASAENLANPLNELLQSMRGQFVRLSGLYHASRRHPTEQVTAMLQMRGLRDSLAGNIRPLQTMAGTLDQRLEEVAALKQEFETLQNTSAQELGVASETAGLRTFTRDLENVRRKLSDAAVRTRRILAPAEATADRFSQTIADIEAALPQVWKEYYLTPSGNSIVDLASAPAVFSEWLQSFDARMGFAYPHSLTEWLYALGNFAIAALIVGLLGGIALGGLRYLPARWKNAGTEITHKALVWIGVGFAVLTASNNRMGGFYFALILCGALILLAGIASMSWRLRIAMLPELAKRSSPLKKLFVPTAVGVIMLLSDLPNRILGLVWGMVLLAFLVHMVRFNKKHPPRTEMPKLEHALYRIGFFFGVASLGVTVFGYARLAILLYALSFALANILMLGTALMALFALITERQINSETSPVLAAVGHAVSIPAAWLLSLICTVPWLWVVPGAPYLFQLVTSAQYSLGIASFSVTRLLLIIVLFFLCRSFIGLTRAYLDHLPERIPNIEPGAIPPIRSIAVYGLWVLFALLALGLLGVNFASLAVVAGGLSVGIGFGMQNLFNNLVSGLMLLFGRTILVGDVVDVTGASGTVEAITIRSTIIRTADRALVYIPNATIMSGQFTNWTRNGRMVRRSVTVGVAYGNDTERVQALLLEIAARQNHVRKTPAPSAAFSDFGTNALLFTVYVFVDNVDNGSDVQSAIRHEINRVFTEQGIEIPVQQGMLPAAGGKGETF